MLPVLSPVAFKEMTRVINYDQERLEVDGLPEYVRDNEVPTQGSFVSISTRSLAEREAQRISASQERQSQRDTGGFANIFAEETPKTDELEALWPGVHQEFFQAPKRTPSLYMMFGFLAGAVVSMACIWGYSAISTMIAAGGKAAPATVATTQVASQAAPAQAPVSQFVDPSAVIKPAHPTHEVQSGDTMAAIAIKEYGRATPRLLDSICKANNLRNANFLQLGQSLNLPDYLPQSAQVAAGPSGQPH